MTNREPTHRRTRLRAAVHPVKSAFWSIMTALMLTGCVGSGGGGGGGGFVFPATDSGATFGQDGASSTSSGSSSGTTDASSSTSGASSSSSSSSSGATDASTSTSGGSSTSSGSSSGTTDAGSSTSSGSSGASSGTTDAGSSSGTTDAGSSGGIDTNTCTPKTCATLGATCGTPDNGCGVALDCGPCLTCTPDCPTGFQCGQGVCKSGNLLGLKLDIKTVAVSGTVTLNGQAPTFGQYCKGTSTSKYLRVRFQELAKGYSIDITRPCNSPPHDFSFSGELFPGTYRVSASGDTTGYSNLPTTMQVIYDTLAITAPKTGLVLDIKTVPVSGLVTLNGKEPTFGQYCKGTSTSKYLRVRFSELKKGYTIDVTRPCNSTPHDFTFATQVFPGTYRVSASGYTTGYSSLPTTMQVIHETLTITAPKPGLLLDIKTIDVAGTVTLNGQPPTFGQYCKGTSTSKYMRVRFVEVSKGYTIDITRPCNSSPHDFSFSGQVFPGVYRVSASGYTTGYSSLPTTPQVVIGQLLVGG